MGTLYFSTAAWVTSTAAHALDLRTGKERFLTDGAVAATLDEGRYKGMLLVASMRTLPEGEAERRRALGQ